MFNLLPDYAYAHNIGFQYVFGSGCMLIYAAICNMNECEDAVKIKKASVMAVFSVIFLHRFHGVRLMLQAELIHLKRERHTI